jgi:hypothetical protein
MLQKLLISLLFFLFALIAWMIFVRYKRFGFKMPTESFNRENRYILDERGIIECIDFKISDEEEKRLIKFSEEQLGKKYNLIGCIRYALGFRYKRHKNKMVCSEFTSFALDALLGIETDYTELPTPGSFYTRVLKIKADREKDNEKYNRNKSVTFRCHR